VLLQATLQEFGLLYPTGVPAAEFGTALTDAALDAGVERTQRLLTGYNEADLYFARQHTATRLVSLGQWVADNWQGRTIKIDGGPTAPIRAETGRPITLRAHANFVIKGVDEKGATATLVFTGDLLVDDWLLPATRVDEPVRHQTIQQWNNLTSRIIRSKPVDTRAEPLLASTMPQLVEGRHEARPGAHCKYCPVKGLCLGWQTGGRL
jgi:hypothetical protein